jgi:hypothetical protein
MAVATEKTAASVGLAKFIGGTATATPWTAAPMTGAFNGAAGAARKRGEASDAMESLSVWRREVPTKAASRNLTGWLKPHNGLI